MVLHDGRDFYISADLNYLKVDPKWDNENPYTLFFDVSTIPGAEPTNIVKQAVEVPIVDVRSKEDPPSLDRQGFEVVDLGSEFHPKDFDDEEWIRSTYYPFICRFLKTKLNVKEAYVWGHKVRYRHPGFGDPGLRGFASYDPPITQAHADFTPQYGLSLFEENWPNFTEDIKSDRLQILNIWRPLREKMTEWPLALCDFETIDRLKDLRKADQITKRSGTGEKRMVFAESYLAHFNTSHKWYYLSEQAFHEGWLLKHFDSEEAVANC